MQIVSDYLVDYTKLIAENAPGFKLIGRNDAIETLSHILVQRESSNILMYGETGVGMSSIIMGLTSRKTEPEQQLPLDIASRRFNWLDVNKMFAIGDEAKITETFEAIIDNLTRSYNRVVVIDDFRDFLDGVESMPNKRLLNMMMGALKKGHFQAIWVCRREQLADILNCHSDVKEVFTPYETKEPSKEEILDVAKQLAPIYEKHHRLKIEPKAIIEAVNLTTQYRGAMAFRAQPYRTLHLIDKAAGEKQLKTRNRAPGLEELEKQMAALIKESASVPADKKADQASGKAELEKEIQRKKDEWALHKEEIRKLILSIGDNEESLSKARRELDAELKKAESKNEALKASGKKEVEGGDAKKSILDFDSSFIVESKEVKTLRDSIRIYEQGIDKQNQSLASLTAKYSTEIILNREDIKKLFSGEAKIPLKKLGVDETQKYLNAEKELSEIVIAQEEAVSVVAGSLRRVKAGLKKPNKPIGSFFFLGPSGVGKTELAKALAVFMHGDQKSLIRIDMSEYKDRSSITRLIGAAPGLVGYEEGGILTNAIQRNPYSIICMDEIEKAHPDVYDVLLQLLDEGRLTDGKGITADFTNAVIICTSNYGARHFLRDDIPFSEASTIVKQALYNGDDYHQQESPFRPEFLNRFTKITCFNRLSLETVQEIARKHISDLGKVITGNYSHLSLEMSDADMKAFTLANYEDPAKGARVITENAIPNKIGDRLAEAILQDLADQQLSGEHDDIEPQPKIIYITYSPQTDIVMKVIPKKDVAGHV